MGIRITELKQLAVGMMIILHSGKKSEAVEVVGLLEQDVKTSQPTITVVPVTEGARGQQISVNLLLYGIVIATDTGLDLSTNNEYWLETSN